MPQMGSLVVVGVSVMAVFFSLFVVRRRCDGKIGCVHMPFIGAIAAAGAAIGAAGAGGAKPVRILRCSSVRSLLASPTERMKARRSSPVSFPISPILISIFAASG